MCLSVENAPAYFTLFNTAIARKFHLFFYRQNPQILRFFNGKNAAVAPRLHPICEFLRIFANYLKLFCRRGVYSTNTKKTGGHHHDG